MQSLLWDNGLVRGQHFCMCVSCIGACASKKLTIMPALPAAPYITPLRSSDIIISFEEIKLYIYIFRYIDSFEELQYCIPVVLIFQQHFLNLPIHALSTCCILRLDHFKLWCVAPQAESVSVEVISNISTFLHNSFWDWLRFRLHWLAYQFQMCELIHLNFFPMDSSEELFTSNRPSIDFSE